MAESSDSARAQAHKHDLLVAADTRKEPIRPHDSPGALRPARTHLSFARRQQSTRNRPSACYGVGRVGRRFGLSKGRRRFPPVAAS